MEGFEEEAKSVGLIFDVSVRHGSDGRRLIDNLKKRMIEVIRHLFVDGEDGFYLYHPKITETVTSHGDQVAAVGNYNTDGWKFNLQNAVRQTLYVLMAEPLTYRKYLIFITDRITEDKALEKALHINDKEIIDCHFIFIGVGNFYDKNILNKYQELENVDVFHLESPLHLELSLFREQYNGQVSQCPTNEQHQPIQLSSGHNCSLPRSVRSGDAIDQQHISSDEEQLLSTDSCGRLQSQSQLPFDSGRECSEECGKTETNQYFEDNTD